MDNKAKNKPIILKVEDWRKRINEVIEEMKVSSKSDIQINAMTRLIEGRMHLGLRLEELGAFDKE